MSHTTQPPALEQVDATERTPQALIQAVQMEIGRMQMTYRDSDPKFQALAVAWQALRFAWYVVAEDRNTAQDKLTLVEETIADYKRLAML
jgi:hypothetical protein